MIWCCLELDPHDKIVLVTIFHMRRARTQWNFCLILRRRKLDASRKQTVLLHHGQLHHHTRATCASIFYFSLMENSGLAMNVLGRGLWWLPDAKPIVINPLIYIFQKSKKILGEIAEKRWLKRCMNPSVVDRTGLKKRTINILVTKPKTLASYASFMQVRLKAELKPFGIRLSDWT